MLLLLWSLVTGPTVLLAEGALQLTKPFLLPSQPDLDPLSTWAGTTEPPSVFHR